MNRFRRIRPWSALVLVILLAATAFGQNSGSLTGIVQDPHGNVIPNVKVTVSEESKNLKLDTTTTDAGAFTFPTLQPGIYTVTIDAPGFRQLIQSGIVINTAARQSA